MSFDLRKATEKMQAAEKLTPMGGNCILRDAVGFERHYTYNEDKYKKLPWTLEFPVRITKYGVSPTFGGEYPTYGRVEVRVFRYIGQHPHLNKPLYREEVIG